MKITNRAIASKVLDEAKEVYIKAAGNSMSPIMTTGDVLRLQKVTFEKLRAGDAVFCKVRSSVFVHLIAAIDQKNERLLIRNNHGHTNGWTGYKNIYGLCTQVNDKILVSEEELIKR